MTALKGASENAQRAPFCLYGKEEPFLRRLSSGLWLVLCLKHLKLIIKYAKWGNIGKDVGKKLSTSDFRHVII